MGTIDSDAHVIETEHTWDFMEESERGFRPIVLVPKGAAEAETRSFTGGLRPLTIQEFWFLEGRAFQKRSSFRSVETSDDQVEMTDIQSRLAHMDELGVDAHILYPTFFLSPRTPAARGGGGSVQELQTAGWRRSGPRRRTGSGTRRCCPT